MRVELDARKWPRVLKRPQAARLLAVDRESPGTRLLLLKRGEAAIGRHQASALRIVDPGSEERHAVITYKRGRYYVADLKTDAGTFVNGKRIRRRVRLKHGDTLRFGNAPPYRFIDPDAEKRRRWRRNFRLAEVAMLLIAFTVLDRYENWGIVSVATLEKVAALAKPSPSPKPVVPTAVAAVPETPQPAAPSEAPTTLPGPADYVANVAPSIAPTVASTPAPHAGVGTASIVPAVPKTWVERLNMYRASNGLSAVGDDTQMSAAAAAHARYVLLNFLEDMKMAKPMPAAAYEESRARNGYTEAGAAAAPSLQLAWGCMSYNPLEQVDRWMAGPFHRLTMLDPNLKSVGYGDASAGGCWVSALHVPETSGVQRPYERAIEFPPDGASIALEWPGLEAPDPLSSCHGYARPVGLPITLQLGRLVDTTVSRHSLTEDGKPIESCVFDAASYRNPISAEQNAGNLILKDSGAVVIVPRTPLRPGARYAVSITSNGATHAWSFSTSESDHTKFALVTAFPTPVATATMTPTTPAAEAWTPVPEGIATAPAHRRGKIAAFVTPPAVRFATPPAMRFETPAGVSSYVAASRATPAAPVEVVASTSSNWLDVLNGYRTRVGVHPVVQAANLNQGCLAHAKYLLMNYAPRLEAGGGLGALMHTESPSMPGYTPEGLKAAQASDVVVQHRHGKTQDELMEEAIEWWMAGAFHRPPLLNPRLIRAGFGMYCGADLCVSVLNAISGAPLVSTSGLKLPQPIQIPPDGATVKEPRFGGEWPNPVSNCPGYPSAATAITMQTGLNFDAFLTNASLTQTSGAGAGSKVATCAYDSQSYTNPEAGDQEHGRAVLKAWGEVVMMVRDPLTPGEAYRIDMTVNGQTYTWSFTAAK